MKGSSSRMKNKVGAQKGAFIKMKQENIYIYQRILVVCYVPIITISTYLNVRNHLVESATECVYVPVRAWIPVNMPLNNMPMRCIP
ncbi:TPA: hypothetical protein I4D22_20225 [Enterobacter asburiae]|nr:hypothetical protein [Enterobacter asburiae]